MATPSLFYLVMNFKILFGNYHGAVSKDFFYHLLDLLRRHKPDMLILVETRTSSRRATNTLKVSSFNFVAVSKAVGFL